MLVAGVESVTWQTLGSIGEFLAGIGVAVAIGQLRAGRRLAKEGRVFDYAERLRDPDLIPIIVEAREFWLYGEDHGTEAGLQRWEHMDPEARHRVMYPLNVLEEIGQAYADRVIDRGLAKKYLQPAAEAYYNEAGWFIEYQRQLFRDRNLTGVPFRMTSGS